MADFPETDSEKRQDVCFLSDFRKRTELVYQGSKDKEGKLVEFVHGKLDDALGLATILEVLQSTDPRQTPDITTLFTVQEEVGANGAINMVEQGYLDEMNLDGIIVFDTSMYVRPGEGLALYKEVSKASRDNRDKDGFTPFEKSIIDLCNAQEIPILPGRGANDYVVFGMNTDIPTVAVEPPIRNMHQAIEAVQVSDIELLRKFAKEYLTK